MHAWTHHLNRFGLALTLLGAIAFFSPQAGLAQVDVGACGAYSSQEDAQADLDANPDLAPDLDPDGDGVACEGFQSAEPTVVDPVSCGFFETQADAQTALDQNPDLALTLDSDGNGIACEDAFVEAGVEITVRAFLCPAGNDGDDVFNQCVTPADDILVSILLDGSPLVEAATAADGSVFFGDLATGDFTIELGVPGDFAEFRTACAAPGANEALTIEGDGTNRIGIALGEGARPACTFFIIVEDAQGGEDGVDEPDAPGEAVTALPSTGSGSSGGDAPGGLLASLLTMLAIAGALGLRSNTRRSSARH